jgi:hypothetical protein
MSNIRDNLLRIHIARNVADTIAKNSIDLRVRALARRLIEECNEATKSLEWNSVKLNLKTIARIMAAYSREAYGNPALNHVDVLRLVGLAMASLDDALRANERPEKRILIETAYLTLLEINALIDGHLVDETADVELAYLDSAVDAGKLETVLEAA